MMSIIGYEGQRIDVPVNWGSAAVVHDGMLLNLTTRHSTSLKDIDELVAEGHLTKLTRPIEVEESLLIDTASIVVELDRKDAAFDVLKADTGRAPGLVAHQRSAAHQLYVFADLDCFDLYCRDVAIKVVREHLYPTLTSDVLPKFLRAALILSSSDPALNALNVFTAAPRYRRQTEQLARASLRSDQDRQRFEDLLEALTMKSPTYLLKYEHGVADGGGLDLDQAVRILGSAQTTHQPFAKEILKKHPYLKNPPPPRFHYMEAASADLHFTAEIEGRPLGERVGRMLELRMLERSLRGDESTVDSPQVAKALAILRSPTAETRASHTPIGGKPQALSERQQSVDKSLRRSEPMVVLGYQSGLIKDADEVEVTFFPPGRARRYQLMLSTRNDGDHKEPIGVRPFQEGRELLLHPAAFTVLVEEDSKGRELVWLRRLQPLNHGDSVVITACPSDVLPGAYIGSLNIKVERDKNRLVTGLGVISGIGVPTIAAARDWMLRYRAFCSDLELSLPSSRRTFKYWRPTVITPPSAVQRILIVLSALGGSDHQARVVAQINEKFGAHVRINNTRREVLSHPELIRFAAHDEQVLQLLPKGRRIADAYLRAAGKSKVD